MAKCASEQTWETKSWACVNDSSQFFGSTSEAPPWIGFSILNTFHAGCAIASCIVSKWKILKSCHILWKDEIPWRCKPRAHISTFLLTAAGSSFGNFINCFSSKAQMFQNKSCFPSKPSYPKKNCRRLKDILRIIFLPKLWCCKKVYKKVNVQMMQRCWTWRQGKHFRKLSAPPFWNTFKEEWGLFRWRCKWQLRERVPKNGNNFRHIP